MNLSDHFEMYVTSIQPPESWSVWNTRTLFCCSPLFGMHCTHCNPFSQKITMSGTVFYHTYVHVTLTYKYIYTHIYILPLHVNNKIKCFYNSISLPFCIMQGCVRGFLILYVRLIPGTRNSSHVSKTALGPERNCSKRKLFKGILFFYDLPCTYQLEWNGWHFLAMSVGSSNSVVLSKLKSALIECV